MNVDLFLTEPIYFTYKIIQWTILTYIITICIQNTDYTPLKQQTKLITMNTKKIIQIITYTIRHHSSTRYITYYNLKQKTGLRKGELNIGLRKLKKQGRLQKRTEKTWEIQD